MNIVVGLILAAAGAYILGSIPSAVWIGKGFYGIDVRDHGSKNAGATNTLRVLGTKPGLIVLFLDALKGALAVSLVWIFSDRISSPDLVALIQLGLGAMALLGHVFPVFASFRGGKGIATLTGIVTVLLPLAVLICLGIFLLVFIPTRYVSLGSLSAAAFFPVTVIWILDSRLLPMIVFSGMVTIFVFLTHKKNIHRLIRGTENKIIFKK
jgi:acyl phosphate:glycerol-3-phosphate acyltransferase